MSDPFSPADMTGDTPCKPCNGDPHPDLPVHPRPAGMATTLKPIHARDYYRQGHPARRQPLDLTPFVDALAAHWDGCYECVSRHTSTIGESPVLTTHVVGCTLLALGVDSVPAMTLAQNMSAAGAAIALTLRNDGMPEGVDVAALMSSKIRADVARYALKCLVPINWMAGNIDNFLPPVHRPRTDGLDDESTMGWLRQEGYL